MISISRRTDHQHIDHGPFQITRIRPGLALGNPHDAGLGPLGVIDHATLQPGVVVGMHQHRNDEILSYLRQGTMVHKDSTGVQVAIAPNKLMMMNAGQGFSHEESIDRDGEAVEMLQIFIRPREADLVPLVAFHAFESVDSPNAWRLVGGPEHVAAPLTIRSAVWLYDAHLTRHTLALPTLDGRTGFLYVFSGEVTVPETELHLQTGDSLIVADEALSVSAPEDALVVLFLVDMQASFSRAGTISR